MYIVMRTNSNEDAPEYVFFDSYMEARDYMLDDFDECWYEAYGNEEEYNNYSEEYGILENGAILHPVESGNWYDWWIFEQMKNS